MSNIKSPFTKEQLLPQEETLEISKEKSELFIGLPKETHFQEKRICLTPDAVAALVSNDHRVLIEKGAGEKAGFSDMDYSESGAELTEDKNKVFAFLTNNILQPYIPEGAVGLSYLYPENQGAIASTLTLVNGGEGYSGVTATSSGGSGRFSISNS